MSRFSRPWLVGPIASGIALVLAGPTLAQTTAPASQPRTTSAPATGSMPSASSVMSRALAAMGGMEQLEKIGSTHARTHITVPGSPAPMDVETFWARPNKAVMRRTISGIQMTHATDGTVAWTTNSMQKNYELLEQGAVASIFRDANPQMALLSLGSEMSPDTKVQRTAFDERTCYRVDLTGPAPMSAYFDVDSGLLAGLSMDERAPSGQTVKASLIFRDWQEHDGVRLAHLILMTMPGMQAEMRTSKLTVNDVEPKVFEQPEQVRALVAERTATEKSATTAPADAPKLSAGMQRFMTRVEQIDDPGQLAGMLTMLEGLAGQASPEEKEQVEFVLKVLRERIAELERGPKD